MCWSSSPTRCVFGDWHHETYSGMMFCHCGLHTIFMFCLFFDFCSACETAGSKSHCNTVVRKTVVSATIKVNGKPRILGTRSSLTPKPIDLKFDLDDYEERTRLLVSQWSELEQVLNNAQQKLSWRAWNGGPRHAMIMAAKPLQIETWLLLRAYRQDLVFALSNGIHTIADPFDVPFSHNTARLA